MFDGGWRKGDAISTLVPGKYSPSLSRLLLLPVSFSVLTVSVLTSLAALVAQACCARIQMLMKLTRRALIWPLQIFPKRLKWTSEKSEITERRLRKMEGMRGMRKGSTSENYLLSNGYRKKEEKKRKKYLVFYTPTLSNVYTWLYLYTFRCHMCRGLADADQHQSIILYEDNSDEKV